MTDGSLRCATCSSLNPAVARFCSRCGNAVTPIVDSPSATPALIPRRASPRTAPNPWLAASLNAIPIPFPAGYAYLGRWWRFGILTLVRSAAALAGMFVAIVIAFACWESCTGADGAFALGAFLLIPGMAIAATCVDAFRAAARERDFPQRPGPPPETQIDPDRAAMQNLLPGRGYMSLNKNGRAFSTIVGSIAILGVAIAYLVRAILDADTTDEWMVSAAAATTAFCGLAVLIAVTSADARSLARKRIGQPSLGRHWFYGLAALAAVVFVGVVAISGTIYVLGRPPAGFAERWVHSGSIGGGQVGNRVFTLQNALPGRAGSAWVLSGGRALLCKPEGCATVSEMPRGNSELVGATGPGEAIARWWTSSQASIEVAAYRLGAGEPVPLPPLPDPGPYPAGSPPAFPYFAAGPNDTVIAWFMVDAEAIRALYLLDGETWRALPLPEDATAHAVLVDDRGVVWLDVSTRSADAVPNPFAFDPIPRRTHRTLVYDEGWAAPNLPTGAEHAAVVHHQWGSRLIAWSDRAGQLPRSWVLAGGRWIEAPDFAAAASPAAYFAPSGAIWRVEPGVAEIQVADGDTEFGLTARNSPVDPRRVFRIFGDDAGNVWLITGRGAEIFSPVSW